MKPEVRSMLDKMYELFLAKFGDAVKAWDRFLELLAADHNALYVQEFDHKFEWLLKDSKFGEKLMKIYDPKLLRSDYHDHLGDMYIDIFPKDWGKRGLDPETNKLEDYTELLGKEKKSKELRILDMAARTGRLLMLAYQRFPKAILFGVEKNKRLYRIALTNFAIFDIPGYLINANSETDEIDLKSKNGRDNWENANLWNPPTGKLKRSSSGPIDSKK